MIETVLPTATLVDAKTPESLIATVNRPIAEPAAEQPAPAPAVWQHPDYPNTKIASMDHLALCAALEKLQRTPKGFDLMDTDTLRETLAQAAQDSKVRERYEIIQWEREAQRQEALIKSFTRTSFRGTVVLEHSAIATHLHEQFNTVSFNKTLYIYDKERGIYRENAGDLEQAIRIIIEETGAKSSITRDIRDIVAYLLATHPRLEYPFNQSKNMLPVQNGILKLNFETDTVECIPHSPAYLFTFRLPVVYDENATGDRFHKEVISQYVDDDLTDALYQIPAMALLQALGRGPYKKAYIIQGNADGGKTSYLSWLHALFGLVNVGHASLQQIGTDSFVNADLEGRLLNTFDDLADVPLMNIGPFKMLTGGYDFKIDQKHERRYNARIFAVHVFTCNAPPEVPERILNDPAFWSRWVYLHFDNVFPMDPDFKTHTFTRENLSGSFNRVIEMMFRIAKDGLVVNPSHYEVKETWQKVSDPFMQFINEHLPTSQTEHAFDKDHLLKVFRKYSLKTGINERKIPGTQKALSTIAFKNGFKDAQRGSGMDKRRVYTAYRNWNPGSEYRQNTEQCEF